MQCPYCGQKHDRAEDAACGCGCGNEPMGCPQCMAEGGPPRNYDAQGRRAPRRIWNEEDMCYEEC